MRPERLEDLGRIRELMERLLSDYDELQDYCNNKHLIDGFATRYGSHGMDELHTNLRFLFERLDEIRYIAKGDLYE